MSKKPCFLNSLNFQVLVKNFVFCNNNFMADQIILYLCGAITNYEGYLKVFHEAKALLQAACYIVESPVEFVHKDPNDWVGCMELDIPILVQKTNAVAVLPNAFQSKGAMIEINLALGLGREVRLVQDWLDMRSFESVPIRKS